MAEIIFPIRNKRIWVAGETGLVGRALCDELRGKGAELLSAPHGALDLTHQQATFSWIAAHKPDAIVVAAAKVGGIGANAQYPADFIRDNLAIAQNVIEGAHRAGVAHLLFLGSSCIYPRDAVQPIREDALMTGPLEPTNEAYAIAKIAGMKMCEFYRAQYGRRYIAAMPTNLYGPHDRFDADASHVIPAMMTKFHWATVLGAPEVVLWGTGAPLREFLHVMDLSRALVRMLQSYDGAHPVNIGSGTEISIRALADMMIEITGYRGKVMFDIAKPDGTPRKFLNSAQMRSLGWNPQISLREGLIHTYQWYREEMAGAEKAA